MNFNAYINQNLARGRNHKVNCIYDSFEMDNPFNQCVKSVCKLLLTASKDLQNKRNLNDILFLLDEVSDVTVSAEECKRILFNPMFADFETVRDYCVLFLENSVSFNYKNDLKLFAFLLPMEYVFEDFLFGFIDKELEEVNAKNQIKNKSLDEAKTFGLKPDLLLSIGERNIIADTKYKMVYADSTDVKKGISQNDLYQMVAYAIRFGVTDIKLFYPNTINNETSNDLKTIEIIDELAGREKITIKAHQVSVLDKEITIAYLENMRLSDCFVSLKNKLKGELEIILHTYHVEN
jgi:5-methylcytosine-specific restriction enzyme subunit McrC